LHKNWLVQRNTTTKRAIKEKASPDKNARQVLDQLDAKNWN
jgi:hypothetical protein